MSSEEKSWPPRAVFPSLGADLNQMRGKEAIMAYEAPKLTEVGSVQSMTLGFNFLSLHDDNHWSYPGQTPTEPGSR